MSRVLVDKDPTLVVILHAGLLLCIQCCWSIARLLLCIILISYANSVINNAGTQRFIIPCYQRRLNTVDLHANSPNDAIAFASIASGQFLLVCFPTFPFILLNFREFFCTHLLQLVVSSIFLAFYSHSYYKVRKMKCKVVDD